MVKRFAPRRRCQFKRRCETGTAKVRRRFVDFIRASRATE